MFCVLRVCLCYARTRPVNSKTCGCMHWHTPWIGLGGHGSFSWVSFSPWMLLIFAHNQKRTTQWYHAWAFSWQSPDPFSIALRHGQRPWRPTHSARGLWDGAAYYMLISPLHRLVVLRFQAWTTCAVWFQEGNKEQFQHSSVPGLWKEIYRVRWKEIQAPWLDKWQTLLEYGPKTGVDATLKFSNISKGYDSCDVATRSLWWPTPIGATGFRYKRVKGDWHFRNHRSKTSYVSLHLQHLQNKQRRLHERNEEWNHAESIQIQRIQTVWINRMWGTRKPFLSHFFITTFLGCTIPTADPVPGIAINRLCHEVFVVAFRLLECHED